MKMPIIAALALGVASVACSNDSEEAGSQLLAVDGPEAESEESLLDYEARDGSLVVRVKSNGCTDKRSFAVDAHPDDARLAEPVYHVRLNRVRPDYCKAYLPEGEVLTWSLEELSIPSEAQVELENAVIVVRPEAFDRPACRPENCDPA